jgi:hypothetical protein
MKLEEIVAKLRKVKYGDYVLADDHNDLVDAITLISKYMKFGSFSLDQVYSVYNDASYERKYVSQSLYSEKIGNNILYYPHFVATFHARVWVDVEGQGSYAWLCFHSSDHPAGEIIEGSPYYLGDNLAYCYYGTTKTTPTEIHPSVHDLAMYPSQTVYAVFWLESIAYTKDKPFNAYCDKIKAYWVVEGFWE